MKLNPLADNVLVKSAQQEETIQTQTATIDSQAAAIQELEAAGTAETVKAELQAAYTEGVESNG